MPFYSLLRQPQRSYNIKVVFEANDPPVTESGLKVQDKNKPNIVALKSGEPDEVTYDAGTARFLASSEDTNGAWSLVELTEKPGYKTRIHRHNYTDVLCAGRSVDRQNRRQNL